MLWRVYYSLTDRECIINFVRKFNRRDEFTHKFLQLEDWLLSICVIPVLIGEYAGKPDHEGNLELHSNLECWINYWSFVLALVVLREGVYMDGGNWK